MANKAIDDNGLLYILQRIKANFARLTHTHAASDISSGTLDAARLPAASGTAQGAMSSAHYTKLEGIAAGANAYTLPTANASTLGGVMVGGGLTITDGVLSADVQSDDIMLGATASVNGLSGLVPAPTSADREKYLKGDGTWDAPSGASLTNLNASNITSGTIGATYLPSASASAQGAMSAAHYTKLEALPTNATLSSTYALKSEITSMYRHKGSVANVSSLPDSGQTAGDVYNVTATGMNYVWTGTEWDAIGQIFTQEFMTNNEIDAVFTSASLTATA